MRILEVDSLFEPDIFATGMHLQEKYGFTVLEIQKSGFKNIHTIKHHMHETILDQIF